MRASYKEDREITLVMKGSEARYLIGMLHQLDKVPDTLAWTHEIRKTFLYALESALETNLPHGLVP